MRRIACATTGMVSSKVVTRLAGESKPRRPFSQLRARGGVWDGEVLVLDNKCITNAARISRSHTAPTKVDGPSVMERALALVGPRVDSLATCPTTRIIRKIVPWMLVLTPKSNFVGLPNWWVVVQWISMQKST